MIPKRIFFYWGNEKMSYLRYMTLESCRYYNPDWEIVLYHDPVVTSAQWSSGEKQELSTYEGEDYLPLVQGLGIKVEAIDIGLPETDAVHRSDLFRWYMLGAEGGIYADMDILWIRPLDDFHTTVQHYDAFICQHKWLSIGFLGSRKNNPFWMDLYKYAYEALSSGYQSVGIEAFHNFLYRDVNDRNNLVSAIMCKYNHSVYNIPMDVVYHYTYKELCNVFELTTELPEESIGIHWYGGHEMSQEWNKLLPGPYRNTITQYIGRMT